jgi:hypothetical protein
MNTEAIPGGSVHKQSLQSTSYAAAQTVNLKKRQTPSRWNWYVMYDNIHERGYSTCMVWGHFSNRSIQLAWSGVIVHTGVFNLHGLGALFMPGYSTFMALGHCLCRGIQPSWPWVIVYAGVFNLHGLGSLFMPGYSTYMALGHCLCRGIQPSWP